MACIPAEQLQLILGKAVKARRLALGWNQSELAERSRIPRSEVSRIEAGRLNVTLLTIARLSLALQVPAADLLWRPAP